MTLIKGVKSVSGLLKFVFLSALRPNTSAAGGRTFKSILSEDCLFKIMAFNFVPNTASSATLQASSILIFCHKRALFFKPLLFNHSDNLPSVLSDC